MLPVASLSLIRIAPGSLPYYHTRAAEHNIMFLYLCVCVCVGCVYKLALPTNFGYCCYLNKGICFYKHIDLKKKVFLDFEK